MNKKLLFIIPILFLTHIAFAQRVGGVVKDSEGAPIVGATIIIKGTKTYSVTDVNGQFSIAAPKEFPFSIRITSTGYKL